MIVLEYLLYVIALPIAWVAWKVAWWLFPKKMSRHQKYKTSEYDFMVGRFVKALSAAIVFGGAWIYFIYCMFHTHPSTH